MAELPSGTVTFLFTDVEGSTRLLKQIGEPYSEVLADHQRLLRVRLPGGALRGRAHQEDAEPGRRSLVPHPAHCQGTKGLRARRRGEQQGASPARAEPERPVGEIEEAIEELTRALDVALAAQKSSRVG
jgi:hypothetical protein